MRKVTVTHEELLAYYTAPGVFTGVDGFADQLDGIPSDVASVSRAVQGLLIDVSLASAYGVYLPTERIPEKQFHSAVSMLTRATQLGSLPVNRERVPQKRVIGVCRHFATLFVAFMRYKGVPSRVRCGFANYFQPGKHLDHWVGEYWNVDEKRWVLVDAQVDNLQRRLFAVEIDTLDVPRDRFLVGGDAWRTCRNGTDPMNFGIEGTEMWGLVEVYGDIFQDLAALQNIELLPWEWYGMAKSDQSMRQIALIDRLAAISSSANAAAIDTLREMIAEDDRLRVPESTVAANIAADQLAIQNYASGQKI